MRPRTFPPAMHRTNCGIGSHRVHAICPRYVELALTHCDLSEVESVAIDETSYKRGHNYLTLAADADARKVVFVTEGRDAETIVGFAEHLRAHNADPQNITSVSIDMSPAFIKGVSGHLRAPIILYPTGVVSAASAPTRSARLTSTRSILRRLSPRTAAPTLRRHHL